MSDLSDLFGKDPLNLTRDDRAQIIAKFRENRANFMAGQRTGREVKVPKEPKAKVAKGSISLGDLEL